MAGVALLHGGSEEGAFLLESLRAWGYRVDLVDDPAAADHVLGADVIVADLDSAIAAGWVRPQGAHLPHLPLVIASPHEAFLDVVRESVAATVLTPAKPAEVVAAVERARRGDRESVRQPAPHDDAERDAILARRGMTSDRVDPELLGIAALVARGVGTSAATITVVDSKRQVFVGHAGLPIDLAIAGGTVRDWSFCQHAVAARAPLVVTDAKKHPLLAHSPLVETNIVRSYAAAPIEIEGLGTVGAVCVLSQTPREYGEKDLATLELGARLAAARLERRGPEFDAPPAPRVGDEGAFRIGELVGDKYWITASLGRGGQSEVFLARDRLSGQMVAIKSMRGRDEQALVAEAEALTQLRHPNIVQLHGWGRGPHDELYLVLEYVEGITLSERIALSHAEQALTLPIIADVVRQLAGALASMHALGFAHGDVKPNNVIWDRVLDRAVLIDFGFPLPVGSSGPPGWPGTGRGSSSPIIGGTPGFSAPEQFVASGSSIASPALDVYSLAAVAYALITGEGPFAGERGRDRVAAQLAGRFPPPSSKRAGVSPEIDQLLTRALAPDPKMRPSSVLELADELEQLIAFSKATRASPTIDEQRSPRSRGVIFRIYRAAVRRREGDEREAEVFALLSAQHRDVFDSVVDDDNYYPAEPLVAYLAAYARGEHALLVQLGYEMAAVTLPEALKSMHLTRTPEILLYAAASLLHRFHDWGRIEIERPEPGLAHVTMYLPPGFATVMSHYFVGIERALLATTGRTCSVEIVSASDEGCHFVVTWSLR